MTLTKKYKIFAIATLVAMVLSIVTLSFVVKAKNNKLKSCKEKIEVYENQLNEQKELVTKLAAMEAIHCDVSIDLKNTAVFGKNNVGDINLESKMVATYLRGELLELLKNQDTLKNGNIQKIGKSN